MNYLKYLFTGINFWIFLIILVGWGQHSLAVEIGQSQHARQEVLNTDSVVVDKLLQSAQYYFEKQLIDSAEIQYQKALAITESSNYRHQKVKSDFADFLRKTGQLNESFNQYEEVLSYLNSQPIKDSIFLSTVYRGISIVSSQLGNFEKGISYCNQALDLLKLIKKPNHKLRSNLYASKGVNYAYLSLYDEASFFIEKSLSIDLQQAEPDSMNLSSAYNNLGVINKWLGNFEKASVFYEKTRKLRVEMLGENHPLTADIYGNIGNLSADLGEYERALEYHQKALSIREGLITDEVFNVAGIYNNIARVYLLKDQPKEALKYAKMSVAQYKQNNLSNHPSLAEKYSTMADIYRALKSFDLALEYSKKSNRLILNNLGKSDRTYLINLLFLGETRSEMGHLDQAAGLFDEAIGIGKELFGNKHPYLAKIFNSKGNLSKIRKMPDSALYYYHQAMISNAIDFESKNIYEIPDDLQVLSLDEYLKAIEGKISIAKQKFDQNPADSNNLKQTLIKLLYTADMVIDKQSARYEQYTDRFTYQERVYGFYQLAIAICYDLYQISNKEEYVESAHFFMEKARFNIFLFKASSPGLLNFESIPDSLISLEKDLTVGMNFYESKMLDQLSADKVDSTNYLKFKNKLFNLSESYKNLIQLFEKDFEEYFNLKYKTRITSLAEAKNNLKADKCIISYYLKSDALYIIGLTKEDVLFEKIPIDDSFGELLQRYITALKEPDFSKAGIQSFHSDGLQLYQKLIEPVEKLVRDASHLVFIPDGNIALIPFEAIPLTDSVDKIDYIVNNWNISYTSSVSFLTSLQKRAAKDRKGNILAIAPFVENRFVKQASTLNWANEEVELINQYIPSKLLKGAEATEYNFRRLINDYSIVHFATHSVLNHKNPLFSKILFSADDQSEEDGLLYARELFGMRIPTEMVVLSSCDTGNGTVIRGEGVVSLAKGFFYAGSRSVVMSIWKANDRTSSDIMSQFYRYLSEGKDKDVAMRLSKLDYLNSARGFESHPAYWAQFLVNGDTKSLADDSGKIWWWITITLLGVVIGVFFYKKQLSIS